MWTTRYTTRTPSRVVDEIGVGGMASGQIYSGFGGTALWLAVGAMAVPLGLGFLALAPAFRAPRGGSLEA